MIYTEKDGRQGEKNWNKFGKQLKREIKGRGSIK